MGLGAGLLLVSLASGQLKERKWNLLIIGLASAALITVGSLGGVGVLSISQLAWTVIGTTGGVAAFSGILFASRIPKWRND